MTRSTLETGPRGRVDDGTGDAGRNHLHWGRYPMHGRVMCHTVVGSLLVFVGSVVAALCAVPVQAQRAPVLDQIEVPHPYYYREMFLPQVSSGPSFVAWSPEGQDLVYAMQGSLWRQRIGTTVAEQLTAGPGYDHQPDWSPDGRFVAYASYRDDAVELRLLDVRTLETRSLLSDGAVHVEPRWSPDGGRLAFVSTRYRGRFHIHTIEVTPEGDAGAITRITEDRDSGLPRYYYSRFDHYLSPTWSPDGRELIVVSNRGRIWGTGGIWRMEAESGASMREIRYEETTWRARPDWSPDGRRIVYSSYLGRQWNQLWVMPDEGGDVFPMTYGDFDATAPRWSPRGDRIAYISNETGNTSLWVMDIPGGGREEIRVTERRYLEPMGHLRISVTEGPGGEPVPARVSVTAADGRGFVPHDAWRHADDAFNRDHRTFEYSYFHSAGTSELDVPAGRVTVEVTRGLEYRPVRRELTVGPESPTEVIIALERIADLGSDGWRSGDLHVHMNYGGAYRATPSTLAFQAAAEHLDVVENAIVNKEQRVPDIEHFTGEPTTPLPGGPTIMQSQEFHTSVWGHMNLLGLRDHIILPDYAGYVNTAAASLYPHNVAVADVARSQGAIVGYVHPFDQMPDPYDRDRTLANELPVGVALGRVDYLEVLGFSDHRTTAEVWYRLLNCGFRIPAGAGTDAMTNFASLRGPVGMNRVYVNTGGATDYASWLGAIRAGRTFVTNGPLLGFNINGHGPGGELRLPEGSGHVQARISLRSIVPVDHLEVVRNGRVVATLPLGGDRTSGEFDITLEATQSGWYTLRAWNEADHPLILDGYPFATTSPIYATVGEETIRCGEDAEYFLAWIDRVEEVAQTHTGWNTAEEREAVLRSVAEAREIFQARR
jgi:TolB protein